MAVFQFKSKAKKQLQKQNCFLKNKIQFTDIFNIVEDTLNFYNPVKPQNIDDVIETDKIARKYALKIIDKVK